MPAKAEAKIKKDALKANVVTPKAKHRPKPQPKLKTVMQPDRQMMEKLAKIGRSNVQKHEAYESKQLLRHKIATHQVNHQYQMEHDRLSQASVQNGLQPHSENRLSQLKKLLRS